MAFLGLFVVAGCGGCDCGGPDVGSPDAAAAFGDIGSADAASEPPSLDVLGVALGAADHAAVLDWTEMLGVPCVSGVDSETGATVLECRDIDGPVPFVRRPYGGVTTRVLAEIGVGGALDSVSVRRRHAEAVDGLGDFVRTSAEISSRLGEVGDTVGQFGVDDASTGPARATHRWADGRVRVELEVLRGMGPDVMVTEDWSWNDARE